MRRAVVAGVVLVYAIVAAMTVVVHETMLPRGDAATWWYYLSSLSADTFGGREDAPLVHAAGDDFPSSTSPAVAVPVLTYHGVVDEPDGTNITLSRFIDQMESLAASGYTAIGLDELASFLAGQSSLQGRPIVITFDDARRDQYRNVDLILARFGWRAAMFVPTRRVLDEDPFFLSWHELRRMAASGRWDLGCHGRDAHDPIPTGPSTTGTFLANRRWLPQEGRHETLHEFRERIRADYRGCRDDLVSQVGLRVTAYAFPLSDFGQLEGGDAGIVAENLSALADTGFTLAFWNTSQQFHHRPGPPGTLNSGAAAPYLLGRLRVPGDWTGAELTAYLRETAPRPTADDEAYGSFAPEPATIPHLP